MNKSRVAYKAFFASGVSVVVAVPASVVVQGPDLVGFVLLVTGTLAVLFSRAHLRQRVFTIMTALVLMIATILAVHVLCHRLDMSHDWLELPYSGAVVIYCALALSLGLRLLRRQSGDNKNTHEAH